MGVLDILRAAKQLLNQETDIDISKLTYDTLCELSQIGHSTEPEDNQPAIIPVTPIIVPPVVEGLTTSKNGLIELANYEALSTTKYLDSGGVATIGIGMTTSEIKDLNSWAWDKAIATNKAVAMFTVAVKKYEDGVKKALKVKVTQNQFDALVSITYNIGVAGMAGSTFMKRINAGGSVASITQAMQFWDKDNGKTVKGLTIRRKAESSVFATGKYLNNGTVQLIRVNPTTHKPIYEGRVDIAQYLG